MKWADLKALQIFTRRSSLRRVCTLKVTLTHLNISCRHRCSEKPKSSEPLPETCAAQAPFLVRVTAFENTTLDSGQQIFVVTKNTISKADDDDVGIQDKSSGTMRSLLLSKLWLFVQIHIQSSSKLCSRPGCIWTHAGLATNIDKSLRNPCHTANYTLSDAGRLGSRSPAWHTMGIDMYRMSTAMVHNTATLHTSHPCRLRCIAGLEPGIVSDSSSAFPTL